MAELNTTQLRDALAWLTNDQARASEPEENPFVWFWEAVQGDFNENRSTAQILADAAISMIPLVDQVCDVRDLIANCRKLSRDVTDTWAWVALVLTLIGLFPSLGSLVKGVLKIFFAYVRKAGASAVAKTVDEAMGLLINYLRRRDVQNYIRVHRIDEIFAWLAKQVRGVRSMITKGSLLSAFDRGIKTIEELAGKVSYLPRIGSAAAAALNEVKRIRLQADARIGAAIRPVQDVIDTIVLRLEKEALMARQGIVDVGNVHYKGALPEAAAVRLMRERRPAWLSKTGDRFLAERVPEDARPMVDLLSAKVGPSGASRSPREIFPPLSDQSIRSFHTLEPFTIRGPARLYRILSPSSRAMSDCWVTEEVFKRLQASPRPKEAWRRFLAVWPDWNVNGQFVIYDIKAGETLNTWRGAAASQQKASLPGHHLEGGWEQIVFNVERTDPRNDTLLYYPVTAASGKLRKPLSQEEVNGLTASMSAPQKAKFYESHVALRHTINHPNISGPFDTGWGYSEFDGDGMYDRIGLPALPGQTTTIRD